MNLTPEQAEHDLSRIADAVGRDRVVYCDPHVVLIHARWQDVIEALPQVDAVITDPPYTSRVEFGYRSGADVAAGRDTTQRKFTIPYAAITDAEALDIASAAVQMARNWIVAFNDHVGWAWLDKHVSALGWYTFSPVVWVKNNPPPRFQGDGPCDACEYILAARPRRKTKVGSLPGYYKGCGMSSNHPESTGLVGQKPQWLMKRLLGDYTNVGGTVLDFFGGSGATGRAAKDLGRKCILIEQDGETCEKAARVLRPHRAWQQTLAIDAG